MNKRTLAIGAIALALAGGIYLVKGSKHEPVETAAHHEEKAEPGKEAQADSTEITKEAAKTAGIKTETAGSATVVENITLTGRITLNQNTTAQVKARFPGIVREVKKGQGDEVKVGDVLAMVESNDSLQVYPVKSPINGVILARNTNIGDVAGETPLFTIANVTDVWAEFHVFPRDIDRIHSGQIVRVTSFEGEHTGEASINVLLPLAEASSQTVVVRVTLPNPQGLWRAGMTVRGDVAIDKKEAPVSVKTSSIQRMEGKTVVFVENNNRYTMRPIKPGLSDKEWTEVREGLQAGENYVSENSFMIKADIGKAGAEHED